MSAARYFPPEWEIQESVFLCWPIENYIDGCPVVKVTEAMVKALNPHVQVSLCLPPGMIDSVKENLKLWGTNNVKCFTLDYTHLWIRDFGPIFFRDNEKGVAKILTFPWTEWGYMDYLPFMKESEELHGHFPSNVASSMQLGTLRASFASEGGDREFNGKGTLLLCEDVELQRNPGKSKSDLETLYKKEFCVVNIIWLKHALADDWQTFRCPIGNTDVYSCFGTGGHVDEFARFVSPSVILLAEVIPCERDTPLGALTHPLLEENYRTLLAAVDQDGKPFHIVRIPLPPPTFHQLTDKDPLYHTMKDLQFNSGKKITESVKVVAASSYCNFLISNGVVLLAKYYKEGSNILLKQTDDQAMEILKSVFPDREIIQIEDVVNVNFGGGGMHCISQQQPVIV